MNYFTMKNVITAAAVVITAGALVLTGSQSKYLDASSHREAPLIANDPLADNTDLYAFRSPDDTNTVTIIACFIPAELPQGGPNYYGFGENIRYRIHIKNDAASEGDDITYTFKFYQKNEDPTTFFNIRLGKQNLKTVYRVSKRIDGGKPDLILENGTVPPTNIGPRSIDGPIGLNTPYSTLEQNSVFTGKNGETIYCGPVDDPFFVDLGGVFDLGQTRAGGTGVDAPKDGLRCKNVHAICIKIPIEQLQKDGLDITGAQNILDPDYVIGVWTSTERRKIRTLEDDGSETHSGNWVQVSRLGMPLTNEVIIPIGDKDKWNRTSPYDEDASQEAYFCNPELGLYMDDDLFGGAVPALSALRIQRNSLQSFDFGNGKDGLSGLLGNPATTGTAFDQALFGNYLLRAGQPRSADLLPIFHTGVPNLAPYQLATGKGGNPLAVGKPFIHNFLPTFGDMLRLNMAVPVTPRTHPQFSSLGIVQAAVLGLTDAAYNTTTALQWIPNMDGFPNGRRLEDDVVRMELQAVAGIALAAIGLWYDDYTAGDPNPVTTDLVDVLTYTTGVETNDTTFKSAFPYVQSPWSGYGYCAGGTFYRQGNPMNLGVNVSPPQALMLPNYPNPASDATVFKYRVSDKAIISILVYDMDGKIVAQPVRDLTRKAGTYEQKMNVSKLVPGNYLVTLQVNGNTVQSSKMIVTR